jgi:hypothetical protein
MISMDLIAYYKVERVRLSMLALSMLMASTADNGGMRLILLILVLVAVALLLTGGTIALVTFFSVRRTVVASLESERT